MKRNLESHFFKTKGIGKPCPVDSNGQVSHVVDNDDAGGSEQRMLSRTELRQGNAKSVDIFADIYTVVPQVLKAECVWSGEGYQVETQGDGASFIGYSWHFRWRG